MRKFIICLVIILFSIFIIVERKDEFQYNNLNEKIIKEIKDDNVGSISNNKELFDKYRYEYNNDEIIGKITINSSGFSMLFAQGNDNEYYLRHLINGDSNNLGAIFLDYRSNLDSSRKINIYGHNNGNIGFSFNYLLNYEDRSFYEENKEIIISSDLGNYFFEIFSIQIVDNRDDYIHMKLDFNSETEWENYLSGIINKSLYKENIDIKKINRVLTLQTCTNRDDYEFLLVNAMEVRK